MEEQVQSMEEARKNFIKAHFSEIDKETPADMTLLLETIPEIVDTVLTDEFGIHTTIENGLVITFITAWKHIINFINAQPDRDFALDVAGLKIGYTTEYHEGDKPSNIVPMVKHSKIPAFVKNHQSPTTGTDFTADLTQKYNAWRSVNLEEVVDKIERDTHSEVLNDYGIDLIVPQAVLPILGAFYAAGLQIAKQYEGEKINMYNVYYIKYKQGHFFAKELGYIKGNLKGDAKNNHKND